MENRKYKVSRDNIFVGKVVKIGRIYRYKRETDSFHTKPDQLYTRSWFPYRSMLFVPNEEKLSNDLLYKTPSYPILNVTDDETYLDLEEESIVIKDACNLAELLEYFGYNKNLTYEDIMRIRKTFFTGRFAKNNCELFGWKEIKPEDWWKYDNEIIDSKKLKTRRALEGIYHRLAGHRAFKHVDESVLPPEYWAFLDKMGDNDLIYAIKWHEKMNAFTPHKQEGPVKKLTRF